MAPRLGPLLVCACLIRSVAGHRYEDEYSPTVGSVLKIVKDKEEERNDNFTVKDKHILTLIREASSLAGYKINIQLPIVFLYTENIVHFAEVKDGKCVFPFYYRNEIFYDCIKFQSKHMWCSINETYQGYWKYCAQEDFAPCVFPFWYRRMIYWQCTKDGHAFGRKWCSLTQNFNKDHVWKYC